MHVGALVLTAYLVLSAFKCLGKIKQTSFSGKNNNNNNLKHMGDYALLERVHYSVRQS